MLDVNNQTQPRIKHMSKLAGLGFFRKTTLGNIMSFMRVGFGAINGATTKRQARTTQTILDELE